MKNFARLVLSEDGQPSSKRVILFILLFAFLFILIFNLFTGRKPDSTLQDQLYYMLVTALGVVFGSNVLNIIKDIKVTQSENNAKVNSPSPTPDTTIVK
jgi:hypothetical protein